MDDTVVTTDGGVLDDEAMVNVKRAYTRELQTSLLYQILHLRSEMAPAAIRAPVHPTPPKLVERLSFASLYVCASDTNIATVKALHTELMPSQWPDVHILLVTSPSSAWSKCGRWMVMVEGCRPPEVVPDYNPSKRIGTESAISSREWRPAPGRLDTKAVPCLTA
eukprot:s6691_g1.t1